MYSRWVKFIAGVAGSCVGGALLYGAIDVLELFVYGRLGDTFRVSAPLFGAGILLGCIAMHYARMERKVEQEQRDRLAQRLATEIERRIAEGVSGSAISPFALYLRPFTLEKEIRGWKLGTGSSETFFLETGKMNFDYFLQEHLSYLDIPLISIGLPDDQEGAGHVITTDPLWRERFHQLAERAKTIIVVPGIQAGVLAEIRWLRVTGLLVNTVFFKPKGYPRADWQKMKEFYEEEEDIEFPDYSPKQLSFRMYSSGRCYELLTWHTVYRKSVMKRGVDQMRTLLASMSEKGD